MIITNLKKTYDGRPVLEMDDLCLEEGKIYAVIGANGCGKSTFAKLLCGVISSDENPGISHCSPDVSVGFMPQKSYSFKMSTLKNLMINKGNDGELRGNYLLKALKLENLAGCPAKKLSGGETARMALARLLMRDYDLLVLDEPSASMDEETTLLAEKLLFEYRDKTGCTVILITHALNQAIRTADEVLFLHDGRLVEQGVPDKILFAPEREETKRFIDFYGIIKG